MSQVKLLWIGQDSCEHDLGLLIPWRGPQHVGVEPSQLWTWYWSPDSMVWSTTCRGRAQPVFVCQLWAWPWSPDSMVWSTTCRGRAQPVFVCQLWAWPWSPDPMVWSTTCRGRAQPVFVCQLWAWPWSPDSMVWSTTCRGRAQPVFVCQLWAWPVPPVCVHPTPLIAQSQSTGGEWKWPAVGEGVRTHADTNGCFKGLHANHCTNQGEIGCRAVPPYLCPANTFAYSITRKDHRRGIWFSSLGKTPAAGVQLSYSQISQPRAPGLTKDTCVQPECSPGPCLGDSELVVWIQVLSCPCTLVTSIVYPQSRLRQWDITKARPRRASRGTVSVGGAPPPPPTHTHKGKADAFVFLLGIFDPPFSRIVESTWQPKAVKSWIGSVQLENPPHAQLYYGNLGGNNAAIFPRYTVPCYKSRFGDLRQISHMDRVLGISVNIPTKVFCLM